MLISPSDICWSTSFSFREIVDKAHVDTFPWGHVGLDSSAFEKYLIWIVIWIVFQYVGYLTRTTSILLKYFSSDPSAFKKYLTMIMLTNLIGI